MIASVVTTPSVIIMSGEKIVGEIQMSAAPPITNPRHATSMSLSHIIASPPSLIGTPLRLERSIGKLSSPARAGRRRVRALCAAQIISASLIDERGKRQTSRTERVNQTLAESAMTPRNEVHRSPFSAFKKSKCEAPLSQRTVAQTRSEQPKPARIQRPRSGGDSSGDSSEDTNEL